jgi:predicted component of type VI protein secretion system
MAELILEIVEGEGAGRQQPLSGAFELGREPGLSLIVNDPEVSRRHARIEPRGGGAVVTDLGSTNGTFVNDQPVVGERELVPGDRVRVGLAVLELRSQEQVRAQPSAVRPSPQIAPVDQSVLQPAREEELSGVFEAPQLPAMLVDTTEPAYSGREAIHRSEDVIAAQPASEAPPQRAQVLASLKDGRVKRQTNAAAFGLLSVVALAVALYFGLS